MGLNGLILPATLVSRTKKRRHSEEGNGANGCIGCRFFVCLSGFGTVYLTVRDSVVCALESVNIIALEIALNGVYAPIHNDRGTPILGARIGRV